MNTTMWSPHGRIHTFPEVIINIAMLRAACKYELALKEGGEELNQNSNQLRV